MEFPLERQDAVNSLYDITGVPRWHAKNTPDRLIAPMLKYHLGRQEKVLAVADDHGLQRLVATRDMQPALPAERTMEEILKRFPEALFQRVHTDGQSADLPAITHNDQRHLEELLQPGLHQFLPEGGNPFRAGVHVRG